MEQVNLILHDNNCEQNVLGVLMTYPEAFNEAADMLSASLFYNPKHRTIYEAISGVVSDGNTPDIVSVSEYVMKHPTKDVNIDPVEIVECTMSVVSSVTFIQHLTRLADLHRRRQMYLIGHKLIKAGTDEIGDTDSISTQVISDLQALDDAPNMSIVSNREAISLLDTIVQANANGTRRNGIPTGFHYLDAKGGLQLSDLVIIAGEFSQGKTSLALDICVNAARNDVPTAFYSTEMQCSQLSARMLSAVSGMSSRIIIQQAMTTEQMKRYDEAIAQVESLPIYFDDSSSLSVERILSSIRTMNRKKGVKVVFIDYLQVLQTNERNMKLTEEQFFGVTARKFKNLAKELNICIVLMSQIARSKDTTEPTLSRIRGSGQINEAADVVLLIYRPEFYGKKYSGDYANVSPTGTALIKLAKGRNIGTGDFICGYNASTTHFYELSTIPRITAENSSIDEDRPF